MSVGKSTTAPTTLWTHTAGWKITHWNTNLCKAQPVKRIEQEPAALDIGAGVQNRHQLMQRFHAAKIFFRRFAVLIFILLCFVMIRLLRWLLQSGCVSKCGGGQKKIYKFL